MHEKWVGRKPVQFWDKRHGFWRYGVCVEEGWKWCVVLWSYTSATTKRVRVERSMVREVPDAS